RTPEPLNTRTPAQGRPRLCVEPPTRKFSGISCRFRRTANVCRVLLLCAVLGGSSVGGHAARMRPQDNTPPSGFTALFNGRDLTHWQGLVPLPDRAKLSPLELREHQQAASEKMRAHWTVVDGVLQYDGKGDSLQTTRDYGDVELYVDWRIE